MSLTRRSFLSSTAAGFVSARSLIAAPQQSSSGAVGANDRVRLGVIGVGRQGRSDMRAHLALPDVEIVAICDVFASNLAEAAKLAPNAKTLTDFRAVLDDKTVDAVILGTPDHWHALMAVMWDSSSERVTNDNAKAAALVDREYRAPWVLKV
jgi:hypothetical protein